jgi:hypothetical protein
MGRKRTTELVNFTLKACPFKKAQCNILYDCSNYTNICTNYFFITCVGIITAIIYENARNVTH